MCDVIVLLLRTLLHYAFAVTVDRTGQRFYLDVFFQLFVARTACRQQNAGRLKCSALSQELAFADGINMPGDNLILQLKIMHRM